MNHLRHDKGAIMGWAVVVLSAVPGPFAHPLSSFFLLRQKERSKEKGDFAEKAPPGKKALPCYPSALLSDMALVVLPIVYQRFGCYTWLLLLFSFAGTSTTSTA